MVGTERHVRQFDLRTLKMPATTNMIALIEQMTQRHLEYFGDFSRVELQIESGLDEAHDGRYAVAADDQVIR